MILRIGGKRYMRGGGSVQEPWSESKSLIVERDSIVFISKLFFFCILSFKSQILGERSSYFLSLLL